MLAILGTLTTLCLAGKIPPDAAVWVLVAMAIPVDPTTLLRRPPHP